MSIFPEFFREGYGCHNENETKKKHSLIEHFIRTLDRISVSLYISKALYSFSYKNLSLFKAKLKEYFCPSFPKKEDPFEYASYAHSFQTFIPLQPLSDKFLHFTLKIRSLEVCSHHVNHTGNNMNFAKSKTRYFLFAPPPFPQDRTTSNNSPPPGPKGWTCREGCLGGEGGLVTSKIEPCIIKGDLFC